MEIPKDILKKLKLREEPKLDAAAQAFVDQIEYKEVLNKEIAEAREYTNVDKYTAVDAHQLVKMDKQHIIEVLVHAMGTIRFLRDWDADTLGPEGKVNL